MGLMSVHLLLQSYNMVRTNLAGSVHTYSDCLGVLNKVQYLPPHQIPSKCHHSDIQKTILVDCSQLTFKLYFSHVKAHQDANVAWENLLRPAQLNSSCDYEAKRKITTMDLDHLPLQCPFSLKPITLFVGNKKSLQSPDQT